jgi:Kdo2-lipid IVA lauroyltransferase/acyltransferase
MFKTLSKTISAGATRLTLATLAAYARLPYPIVRMTGRALGLLAYAVAGRRRKVAQVNLQLCMPQLSARERNTVVRHHFEFYARSFLERFIAWQCTPDRLRSLVQISGMEHFESMRGKPVIILAPHFLGLDTGGMRIQLDVQVSSMYSKQSNPVLDEVTLKGRTRFNNPILFSRQDGLLPAVRHLRSGTPLYFLPDMDLGPRDAVFSSFFGVPAATVTSVSRLAKLTGATVLPVVTTLHNKGYSLRFYPPWNDYPAADPQAAADYMNAFIEERVRENPAQYLWTHKRFKTRPPGEPAVYGKSTS